MFRKWIVRGVIAAALAASSAMGITNIPAGASTGYDVTYTTDADFDGGTLFNVNHNAPNNNQLQLNTNITTFPSLWVANAGEDSVSKIHTQLNKESARYRTWFNGSPTHDAFSGPAPSRTAVSASGDAFVLNRAFSSVTGARQPTLVKIKATGFVDRNGNGVEDTSTDTNNDGTIQAAEMMTVGPDANSNGYPDIAEFQDEKVEWITRVGNNDGIGRSLCIAPNGNVWVGTFQNTPAYWEVSGTTGAILAGPINTGVQNYGCVVDSNGILYGATISDRIVRVDTNTKTFLAQHVHGSQNYGITAHNGLVYVSMLGGPRMYKTWNGAAFADGGQPGVGITAAVTDGLPGETVVFMGRQNGLTYRETNGVLNWTAGPNNLDTRGTILDSDGNVWRIHMNNSTIVKYDKNTGAVLHSRNVGLFPYTYSDATGINAITSTPSGHWQVTQDSGGLGTIWDTVRWNTEPEGSVPTGASIVVEIKAADTLAGLALAPVVTVPSSGSPLAGVLGQYAEVTVRLTANSDQESPILSDVQVTGHPPNQPPTVTCTDLTLFTSPTSCSAPSATVGSASDPDGDPLTITQTPEGPYGLGGPTVVSFTATDPAGASASCNANVTVVDNVNPTILCPAPTTIECTGPGTMFSPAAATASDNCSVTVNNPGAAAFPLGTTTLSYSATDGSGNSASCVSSVTVADTSGPVISSLTNSFATIWPPNHNRMVSLDLSVSVTDGCVGGPIPAAACRITNITSDEAINALGDGNTDPDWTFGPGLTGTVRAERAGNGDGRVYTITVVCTDANGNNSAPATTTVAVPHNQ